MQTKLKTCKLNTETSDIATGREHRHRTEGGQNTKQKPNPKNKTILRINLKHKIIVFRIKITKSTDSGP